MKVIVNNTSVITKDGLNYSGGQVVDLSDAEMKKFSGKYIEPPKPEPKPELKISKPKTKNIEKGVA